MDCRTASAHTFRQYDVILTKEQSVVTRILILFERENTQT